MPGPRVTRAQLAAAADVAVARGCAVTIRAEGLEIILTPPGALPESAKAANPEPPKWGQGR